MIFNILAGQIFLSEADFYSKKPVNFGRNAKNPGFASYNIAVGTVYRMDFVFIYLLLKARLQRLVTKLRYEGPGK
jgi:hypothetical protein